VTYVLLQEGLASKLALYYMQIPLTSCRPEKIPLHHFSKKRAEKGHQETSFPSSLSIEGRLKQKVTVGKSGIQ
jgi:hypothetical protein